MKCPRCSVNHSYKLGMTCSCGYQFALDPKTDRMADGRFAAMIRKVSANDTYYFTINQLRAEQLRRSAVGPWFGLILFTISVIALIAGWFIVDAFVICLAISGVTALMGAVAFGAYWFGPSLDASLNLEQLIKKWENQNGPIDMLLRVPEMGDPPPDWREPDIYDYGVERIFIVERDLLVDLFVKNNFHSTQRALVVSASGYPCYLVDLANRLLAERDDLPVFLLHDAREHGSAAFERASKTYHVAGRDVVDLGLTMDDVKDLKFFHKTDARRKHLEVPVDYLPYERLQAMVTACFISGAAFHTMLMQDAVGSRIDADFG